MTDLLRVILIMVSVLTCAVLNRRIRRSKTSIESSVFWILPVSYTHLRAHETGRNLVCRLLLEKKKKKIKKKKKKKFFFFFFFNDTATTEIYTLHIVGSVRCV